MRARVSCVAASPVSFLIRLSVSCSSVSCFWLCPSCRPCLPFRSPVFQCVNPHRSRTGTEIYLFRLPLQLSFLLFLDGFRRFLFNVFPGVSGFCHHCPPLLNAHNINNSACLRIIHYSDWNCCASMIKPGSRRDLSVFFPCIRRT